MRNTTRKQARSITLGYSALVDGNWEEVVGTRHAYSYNNPSRRKTVSEVILKLANGNALRLRGNERVTVGW